MFEICVVVVEMVCVVKMLVVVFGECVVVW